jgi:hypothetical protein
MRYGDRSCFRLCWNPAGFRVMGPGEPVVSLRSTTGYRLASLRDGEIRSQKPETRERKAESRRRKPRALAFLAFVALAK